MQVTTELKSMFSYSFFPIFFTTLALILLSLLANYYKKSVVRRKIAMPYPKDLLIIKKKYLLKIQTLLNDFYDKKISDRHAYQSLSRLVRNFIYEVLNIKVQNYTLKEIKMLNIPILDELVSEYYDPEFSKISKGNVVESIEKTRMVIEKWN